MFWTSICYGWIEHFVQIKFKQIQHAEQFPSVLCSMVPFRLSGATSKTNAAIYSVQPNRNAATSTWTRTQTIEPPVAQWSVMWLDIVEPQLFIFIII